MFELSILYDDTNNIANETNVDVDLCGEATRLHSFFHVQLIQWLEILFDLLSIVSMIYLIRTRWFRKIAAIVNPSLKLIGSVGIGFYFVGIGFSLLLHLYFKFLQLTFIGNFCHFSWKPISCLFFRVPVTYAFIGFNLFHVALTSDRARVTFTKEIKHELLFGQLMVFFMITVAGLMTLLIFGDDNFVDKRSYCLANSNENNSAVILISISILSASDLCTAILDVMIYYVTWKRMKCKLQGYNLSTKFRLQETQVSMRLIIPFSIIHATAYFIYTMIVIFSSYYTLDFEHQQKVQTLQVVSMCKSFYLSGVPILILIFRLKNNRRIDEWLSNQNYAEVYFQLFKNQIN